MEPGMQIEPKFGERESAGRVAGREIVAPTGLLTLLEQDSEHVAI